MIRDALRMLKRHGIPVEVKQTFPDGSRILALGSTEFHFDKDGGLVEFKDFWFSNFRRPGEVEKKGIDTCQRA